MKLNILSVFLFGYFFVMNANAGNSELPVWSYESETGPAYWGRLNSEYKACSQGKQQSPVAIESLKAKVNFKLPPIEFTYSSQPFEIKNISNRIKIKFKSGNVASFFGKKYELLEADFHAPAEHIIDGKAARIEIQLVHHDLDGHLLVLAIMVNKGRTNFALETFFNNIPNTIGNRIVLLDKKMNPLDFFPESGGYYIYKGSLTTPACAENVIWIVLTEPIQASLQQIMKLTSVYRFNARPVQPLNRRKILRKM